MGEVKRLPKAESLWGVVAGARYICRCECPGDSSGKAGAIVERSSYECHTVPCLADYKSLSNSDCFSSIARLVLWTHRPLFLRDDPRCWFPKLPLPQLASLTVRGAWEAGIVVLEVLQHAVW